MAADEVMPYETVRKMRHICFMLNVHDVMILYHTRAAVLCRLLPLRQSSGLTQQVSSHSARQLSSSPSLFHNVPMSSVSPVSVSSSRDFFAQPSPGAVLANGAPAALQKKIMELMRRQSDTIKWEQKNTRTTEHCTGLTVNRASESNA